MKKKILYNIGLASMDFLVFYLICILGVFIATRDPGYLDGYFLISVLVISLIK